MGAGRPSAAPPPIFGYEIDIFDFILICFWICWFYFDLFLIVPGSGMGCLIYFDLCFDLIVGYSQNNQILEAAWLWCLKLRVVCVCLCFGLCWFILCWFSLIVLCVVIVVICVVDYFCVCLTMLVWCWFVVDLFLIVPGSGMGCLIYVWFIFDDVWIMVWFLFWCFSEEPNYRS